MARGTSALGVHGGQPLAIIINVLGFLYGDQSQGGLSDLTCRAVRDSSDTLGQPAVDRDKEQAVAFGQEKIW